MSEGKLPSVLPLGNHFLITDLCCVVVSKAHSQSSCYIMQMFASLCYISDRSRKIKTEFPNQYSSIASVMENFANIRSRSTELKRRSIQPV